MMKVDEFKKLVTATVGEVSTWKVESRHIRFRTLYAVKIQAIMALSEALGTDEINFDFGGSGSPGYSEATPGFEGHPGYIEVKWPLKRPGTDAPAHR